MYSAAQLEKISFVLDQIHKYSPAPRHRRNIIMRFLKKIKFTNCLETGCAQGYLLQTIVDKFNVQGYGCDIAVKVITNNQQKMPHCTFQILDLEKTSWPDAKQFDVVISSEVVEHIADWQMAIKHLTAMTKHYLIITVPGGKIRPIDKIVGHFRHFQGKELTAEIEKYGFTCKLVRHGFPIHSLYKKLINFLMPNKIYAVFTNQKEYSFWQKLLAQILYGLFYINYFFNRGEQIFIFAERK